MTANNKMSLLEKLISRGDQVAIVQGRLIIHPASKKPIPEPWLSGNRSTLVNEIITLTGEQAYTYQGYSTGNYGKHTKGGMTIQLANLTTGDEAFVIFNVELTRKRNSKHGSKGEPLPKGQFRVSTKHTFYKFWLSTSLNIPSRLSVFHDYMGNLKELFFTPELDRNGKVLNKIMPLLDVKYTQIKNALNANQTYKSQAANRQQPDNPHTRIPDKETPPALASIEPETNQSTCGLKYGNKLQGSAVLSKPIELIDKVNKPQEQTCKEWLIGFD